LNQHLGCGRVVEKSVFPKEIRVSFRPKSRSYGLWYYMTLGII
jgi:hypothetical protein